MKNSSKTVRGSILILISALMYGSYGLFSKLLISYDIFFQNYVRCFIITAILLVYCLVTHQLKKIERKNLGWLILILIVTNFTIAPITYSFRYLTLGTASFLFYSSYTIFAYIFGYLFFKEKFTAVKIASLLLSMFGLVRIFSLNTAAVLILPALMAVVNGFASSAEVTFSKKISGQYSSSQITMLVFGIIGITHIALSLFLHEHQDIHLITSSFPLLLGFCIAAILGMVTVVEGYKYVDPSIGAIIGLMEIVFSAGVGILVFHEDMTMGTFVGGTCIILAAVLPNIKEFLDRRKEIK